MMPELTKKADIKEARRLLLISQQVAGKLYDIHLTGAREDAFRSPMQLYGRLSALASDLNSAVDFAPTNQQGEVHNVLNNRLTAIENQFNELLNSDVKAFNKQLEKSRHKIDIEKKS